jgi:hypothetical protein
MNTDAPRRMPGPWAWLAALVLLCSASQARAIDLDDVMHGIQMVETGGRDIGLHPDGVTYGRYGVTYMAVKELQRIKWIDSSNVDLSDPATNKRIATLYITYLKDRYGSWWEAVKHYNPRSSSYARKVWAAIDRRRQSILAAR